MSAVLSRKQEDFLHWHAVTKMRASDFSGARSLFNLLVQVSPSRTDVALGLAYCLLRLGESERASAVIASLRRQALRQDDMALLGRLHRRCEFERTPRGVRKSGASATRPVAGVRLPHELVEHLQADAVRAG